MEPGACLSPSYSQLQFPIVVVTSGSSVVENVVKSEVDDFFEIVVDGVYVIIGGIVTPGVVAIGFEVDVVISKDNVGVCFVVCVLIEGLVLGGFVSVGFVTMGLVTRGVELTVVISDGIVLAGFVVMEGLVISGMVISVMVVISGVVTSISIVDGTFVVILFGIVGLSVDCVK
jgi:hypothetical protein